MARDKQEQNLWRRHIRIYRFLTRALTRPVGSMFNYAYDTCGADEIEGPVIVIPNHACAWDPILTGVAFRKKQMYFVASEHILRWKVLGPVINWLVQPVPRKKAGMATGTVMTCLRHLRAGRSIVLFAEGEQTWTGRSGKAFPATGKLVKQSGATLVTFRIEGAYLALPRWASGVRKGKVYGHTVNIYPPEQLKKMTADEITEAIDRDIYFDIWKWQDEQPNGRIRFRGKSRKSELAAGLEKAVFICPECRRIGTLRSSGDTVSCSCGFRTRFSETGFFEGGRTGISTIYDWDEWQKGEFVRQLDELAGAAGGTYAEDEILSDDKSVLLRIEDGHTDEQIAEGRLRVRASGGKFLISVGDKELDVADIRLMAMVLSNILLIQADSGYYQILTEGVNLRKYLQIWEYLDNRQKKV